MVPTSYNIISLILVSVTLKLCPRLGLLLPLNAMLTTRALYSIALLRGMKHEFELIYLFALALNKMTHTPRRA